MPTIVLDTSIDISTKKILEAMKPYDIPEFVSAVAEKFDQDFKERADLADKFAKGLSEKSCRFLAEVVTSHYMRQKSNS